MSLLEKNNNQEQIILKFFSDQDKRILLRKDEILLHQNEQNTRLFYVRKGKLCGFLPDKHLTEPVFEAPEHSFVGVYSYFSGDHKSYSRVVATLPCEVYYCDVDPKELSREDAEEFLSFLLSIVVIELRSRQQFAASMANERQEALNKLIQTEKLITLGQLASGLAHELNNTIGAMNSNLEQLIPEVGKLIESDKPPTMYKLFQQGKSKGIQLSRQEIRDATALWPSSMKLKRGTIKRLTKAGISPKDVKNDNEALEAASIWDLGRMFHDMQVASKQATHVINSIKTMGIGNQRWSKHVSVNQTIEEALVILRNLTKDVTLTVELAEGLTAMEACHGELVQVWVNLIKNAVESLRQHNVASPHIQVKSTQTAKHIKVLVADNGIGIDPSIIDRIYEPSFTTKVAGISLGLGLGLTIAQRIVSEHDGKIMVDSEPGSTCFTVSFRKKPKDT